MTTSTEVVEAKNWKGYVNTFLLGAAAVALALLVEPFSRVSSLIAMAEMVVALLLGALVIGILSRERVAAASLAVAATVVYVNKALLNRSLISFFDIAIWSLENLIGRYASTVALVVFLAVIIRFAAISRRRVWLAALVLLLIVLSIPVPWPATV